MLTLDHLAVAATDLATGKDWVEAALGVPMQAGGQHQRYGTHNVLLGLGDDLYLEVIAKDPAAAPYDGPTWFGLDHFTGPPRLANWICQTDDLPNAPDVAGPAQSLSRGDLAWQITVPPDGGLPYDGGHPTLIVWDPGTLHPARRLKDVGCRLIRLTITHPQADHLRAITSLDDARVVFQTGPLGFAAIIDTPDGHRTLA